MLASWLRVGVVASNTHNQELNRRRQWHPTPVLLPGKSHGWRAWWAVVHGVAKSRTRLRDFTFTFTFHFHALEKEMATHSSVLAWRIPGTGEPGGLPSMDKKVKRESEVAQLCLTLSDPMDCSLPGSSIHGIFQATVLEWGAIAFSEK